MVDSAEQHLQKTRTRSSVVERYYYQFIPPFEQTVFPIFQRYTDGTSQLAGTGFFIAPCGIFVSAAHVFEIEVNEGDSFWMIYVDSEGQIHELEFDEIRIKPENRDIAMGQVSIGTIDHPIVSIMELLPEVNEVMASFAFSHTLVHESEEQDDELVQLVHYRSHWEIGKTEEVNHDGFWQVPGPAFSSSILVEGRASGGPVFNSNGFVVGINCRGMASEGNIPYSISTSMNGIRELEFQGSTIKERRTGLANKPIAVVYRQSQPG